jgi:SARP family transcriptional regulator, regulator of embCAB operon
VQVNVLGPLAVSSRDRIETPKASMLRKVLALLAVHIDRMVRTEELKRELWGADEPTSSTSTLHTYISQLRKFLAETCEADVAWVSRNLLVTEPGGYILQAPAGNPDLVRFEERVSAGYAALAAGKPYAAIDHLGGIVRDWDGAALTNVVHGPALSAVVARLGQQWLSAAEDYFSLELQAGRHQRILGELTGVALARPLNERLHGLLITALQRSGQRAAALACYRELRARLVDELGLEPTMELERIHRAVLSTDPGRLHPASPAARPTTAQSPPPLRPPVRQSP